MLKILTKILKKISLPLVVIYIAFLSYNYNFFHVVNDKWFFTHGQPTKRLIVDGLLRGKDEYGRLSLGLYSHPDLKDEEKLLLHKLYDDKNKPGNKIPPNQQSVDKEAIKAARKAKKEAKKAAFKAR